MKRECVRQASIQRKDEDKSPVFVKAPFRLIVDELGNLEDGVTRRWSF